MTRLVVLGGFLGAGKTTWLLQAAHALAQRGYRVGYVSNDQGAQVVDTALAQAADVPVAEIAGGCFCCRYPELLTALRALQAHAQPDVVLAEPVGSCTDLVATVFKPLLAYEAASFDVAPLSVMLDATASPPADAGPVAYLKAKQWEEAQLALLNKTDRASRAQQAVWQAETHRRVPGLPLRAVSGRTGQGLDAWLDIVLGRQCIEPESLVIDYARYAQAEAALGWLNARGHIRADRAGRLGDWTRDVAQGIGRDLEQAGHALAHLKILAWNDAQRAKGSQIGAVWTWDLVPDPALRAQGWEFILNVRAGAAPALIEEYARQSLARVGRARRTRHYLTHLEAFAPLAPRPTHRMA